MLLMLRRQLRRDDGCLASRGAAASAAEGLLMVLTVTDALPLLHVPK